MVYSSNTENAQPITRKKTRVPDLLALKGKRKISSITCYDSTFARLLEKSKVDFVLVGDSLGHVIQGLHSTIPVTVNDIAYHTQCVARALHTPLLVSDMPFASAGFDDVTAYKNCEILLRAGAEAVKIEGASDAICRQIVQLTQHGIPVMGHIGLTPQSVHALGGYKIQGKTQAAEQRLLDEARKLQDAGCFAIVLELVTPSVAKLISDDLKIPTIGIGAGVNCDGQILVLQDMLGMNLDFKPKFLKHFANLENIIVDALNTYCDEIEKEVFPE